MDLDVEPAVSNPKKLPPRGQLMCRWNAFAPIFLLLMLVGLTRPATAKEGGTPEGATKHGMTVGEPEAGELRMGYAIQRDGDSNVTIVNLELWFTGFEDVEEKATMIQEAVQGLIDGLPPEDRGLSVDRFGNRIEVQNKAGFRIAGWAMNDKTMEKDTHESDLMVKSSTCDLSGTPSGGRVNVEVDDVLVQSFDTFGLVTAEEVEEAIAMSLSLVPGVAAITSSTRLCPDVATSGAPFDGQAVLITEFFAGSYAIQVLDPGLVVRQEFLFDDRGEEIGFPYCEATLNSTGLAAEIWARGSLHFGDDYLILEVDNVPNQYGIFFAGPDQINMPFGEGFRCVGGGVIRLSAPKKAAQNRASTVVDLELLPLELVGPSPNFQYWYRDPLGGGSNFNLSNAVRVPFE